MSVRLDRMQRGFKLALAGVAPLVAWTYGHPAIGTQDAVLTLRFASGPSPAAQQHHQGVVLLPATSTVIRVSSATAPKRSIARLNGFAYQHDVVDGETVTEVRDDLLAQIQAGEVGAVTAEALDDDAIALTADFLGGLRSLELSGGLASESTVFDEDENAVLETTATVRGLVTLTAYSKKKEPKNGAWSIIDKALDELRALDRLEVLDRYGIALGSRGPVNDLSAVAGAGWETRVAVDVAISAKSVFVRPVPLIDTVKILIDAGEGLSAEGEANAPA